MNKQSKKVKLCEILLAVLKSNRAYLLRKEISKSHLNNRICQHCCMRTSTATHSFYYAFNISLSCNNSIPSFIGNLWRVLLPGNLFIYLFIYLLVVLVSRSANEYNEREGLFG